MKLTWLDLIVCCCTEQRFSELFWNVKNSCFFHLIVWIFIWIPRCLWRWLDRGLRLSPSHMSQRLYKDVFVVKKQGIIFLQMMSDYWYTTLLSVGTIYYSIDNHHKKFIIFIILKIYIENFENFAKRVFVIRVFIIRSFRKWTYINSILNSTFFVFHAFCS